MTNGSGSQPLEPKWLWYILSFIVPVLGIVLGAIYLSKPEPENKKFGKNCLIAAVAYFIVVICCVVAYFVFFVGIMGLSLTGAALNS